MKNIAVLFYDLTVEYHISIANGIVEYFRSKPDTNILFVPTSSPHSTEFDWDYQCWTITQVIKSNSIDAIIVVTNSFVAKMKKQEIEKELRIYLPRKIVSIAVPLDIPGVSYTCISSRKTYFQIIEHLVQKHNKTKIAYISAELDGSPEANERLLSFKDAMKKNKLEINPEWIFAGDFSPSRSHRMIHDFYEKNDSIPFDAVLCANDYSAYGALNALKEIGMKIPEDICVFGFDDSDIAITDSPTISTVNQHINESAYKACDLAYKAVCGEDVPPLEVINCEPVYRQSCGCVSGNEQTGDYVTQTGEYVDISAQKRNNLNLFGNALDDMASIYHLINLLETINTVSDFFTYLNKNLSKIYIGYMAVCLYDKIYEIKPEDSFVIPDYAKANLIFECNCRKGIYENYFEQGGIPFNIRQSFLPSDKVDLEKRNYYIIPIYLREKNYGYIICELPMNKYTVYEIYLKVIANAFIHSYEFTKAEEERNELEETNIGLRELSKTDELTGIYNRRGFMDFAQQLIDLSTRTKTSGSVFFFDLDGLKIINDTWGHSVGDKAIQIAAKILKDSFHKSDIVGRLSGDEFAVIAPGFIKANTKFIREKIIKLSQEYSKEAGLPFVVSTSLGVVEFNERNSNLDKLLFKADKELYKEKRIKHSNQE